MELDRLPVNENGKVDRRALPAPEGERPEVAAYVAPRTGTEAAVARIWEQVLGLERVGAEDNFFELGGHSLLATQVVSRIRDVLGCEAPVRWVFEHPTVGRLAGALEGAEPVRGEQAGGIPRREGRGPCGLSFSQQRLWFLDQLEPESTLYNIHDAMPWKGRLDRGALERAFGEVVRRHEVLRTTFTAVDGVAMQVVGPAGEMRLEVVDLSGLGEEERADEAARVGEEDALRPFDLERGPLLRARLVKLGKEEHVLLMTMHHIVSDGWSMGVLHRELETLYEAYAAGRESPLAELPIQYTDFAVWQRNWLRGEELERQLAYWKGQLDGAPRVIDLPTDRPRPACQTLPRGDATHGAARRRYARARRAEPARGRDAVHDPARGLLRAAAPLHAAQTTLSWARRSPAAPAPRWRG